MNSFDGFFVVLEVKDYCPNALPVTNRQPSLQHSYKMKHTTTETPSSQNYVGVNTTNKNILWVFQKTTVTQNKCFHSEFISTAPILENKQDIVLPTLSQTARIHGIILSYLISQVSFFSFDKPQSNINVTVSFSTPDTYPQIGSGGQYYSKTSKLQPSLP